MTFILARGHTPSLTLMDNSWRTPAMGSSSRNFTLNITSESLHFLFLFFNIFFNKNQGQHHQLLIKSHLEPVRDTSHTSRHKSSISLWDHRLMFNKSISGPFTTSHLDLRAMTWWCKCLRTCTCITLLDCNSCEFSGHHPLRNVIFTFILSFNT